MSGLALLAAAVQLYSVTVFYGPPVVFTVYAEEDVTVPADAQDLERKVAPSICRAIESEILHAMRGGPGFGGRREVPAFLFPVRYEVAQWERVAGHGYRTVERGGGSLRDCPPGGGTPG